MQKSVSSTAVKAGSKPPTASKTSRWKPSVPPPATAHQGSNGSGVSRSTWPVSRAARAQSGLSRCESKRAATKSWRSSARPMAASQPGATVSSASQNRIDRPAAARIARFSAFDLPGFAAASTRRIATSGWRAACSSKIATEASVEPLSAKTISQGRSQRCAVRLSRVSPRVAAPFRQAMMTLASVMRASVMRRGSTGRARRRPGRPGPGRGAGASAGRRGGRARRRSRRAPCRSRG